MTDKPLASVRRWWADNAYVTDPAPPVWRETEWAKGGAEFVLASDYDALRAEVERLHAAAEPFAELLQDHHARMDDAQPLFGVNNATIYIGQLRELRAALAGEDK